MNTIERRPTFAAWRRIALAGAVAAGAALAAPAQREADKVFLRAGTVESGKVVEEGFAGVIVQPEKGAKKTVPWDQVQTIEYFDAPEELGQGLATLGAGNLEVALTQFTDLLASDAELRPPIEQQALFYSAFIQQRLGKSDEAIAGYQKLITQYPKGRFLRLAGENLVTLELQKGDAAGAAKTVEGLGTGAKDVEGFAAEAGLLEALLLEGQKKFGEARDKYSAVEAVAGASDSAVKEAKLGKARMLLRDGKRTEAEPIFRTIVSAPGSARVQSGAWNGLGEIWNEEGKQKREHERILDGMYAYLRTVVQYKPLLGESTTEYERALSGAATSFQYLSEIETNPEKKKLWRDRSRERLDQLRQDYPNSVFLKH